MSAKKSLNRSEACLRGGDGDLVPPSKSVKFMFSRGFSGHDGRCGGRDYKLRSAHAAKHVCVDLVTNWGPPCAEPPRKKKEKV